MPITSVITASKTLFQARNFALKQETISLSNGETIVKELVRHPGAVVILPRTATGSFVLINQFRAALGFEILEFPAGTLEVGETPDACARREIIEETNYSAKDWSPLGAIYPAPGFCDEKQFGFLASGLAPASGKKDDDEIITVVELTAAEIESSIESGRLSDSKSIAFYYRAKLLGLLR